MKNKYSEIKITDETGRNNAGTRKHTPEIRKTYVKSVGDYSKSEKNYTEEIKSSKAEKNYTNVTQSNNRLGKNYAEKIQSNKAKKSYTAEIRNSKSEKIKLSFFGIDKTMLLIILLLLTFGSVMVFSASAPYAKSNYGDGYYFVKRQIFWAIIGLCGMTVCAATPLDFHKKYTAPIGFSVAFFCLVAVLFSGASVKRWLNLGFFSFQPSELMKPMLILILALYMERVQPYIRKNGISGRRGRGITNKKLFARASLYGTFIPVGMVALICVLIMLENHFSGTIITFAIGAVVIFSGGAMIRWFAGAGAIMLGVVFAVLFGTDYATERIDIWLHPERFSVRDETWQITQGLIAIGSGGVFGRGLGNGLQKQLYVSAAHNDFIFSIVCEELGLVGAVGAILLFAAFVKRGLAVARRADSLFGSLTAVGITGHVGLQAFLNIGVVTGTIPNTGVTLPFFSYGGSALVVLLCEAGILLSVSRCGSAE